MGSSICQACRSRPDVASDKPADGGIEEREGDEAQSAAIGAVVNRPQAEVEKGQLVENTSVFDADGWATPNQKTKIEPALPEQQKADILQKEDIELSMQAFQILCKTSPKGQGNDADPLKAPVDSPLPPGTAVVYDSASMGILPAVVLAFNEAGTYNLDVQENVTPERVLPRDRWWQLLGIGAS